MKKCNFKQLALVGVTGAIFLTSQANAQGYGAPVETKALEEVKGSEVKKEVKKGPLTETQLLEVLNDEAKETFMSLSPEGKTLALKLANQTCKGANDCKGLNACKTLKNACAGQGLCKGQSKCGFEDKNQAVPIAADHMAKKRSTYNQTSSQNLYRRG